MKTLVGRRFAGFSVEEELGAGGMGVVVLARQESLDRPAVLKRIHPQWNADAELEARFEREAIAAARLHHPNVVGVYDRFVYRGDAYIATEYVDGVDLAGLLSSEGRLPWRIAGMIALEMSRGLEAIHATGTLHRDIKPHNILIGRRGEVKITDFGLALDAAGGALTQPGIAVGTPPYMAPEQLRGERVDPRADLFSLGCVLYEMMVGRPPYGRVGEEPDVSLLARVEAGRYPKLRGECRDAPSALVRLVRRCLDPKVTRRVASAACVRERLEALLRRPSGADCQHAIAGFLWDRRAFESREHETVVMVVRSPARDRLPVRGVAAAAAAVLLSLGLLGVAMREPARAVALTEGLWRTPPIGAFAHSRAVGSSPAESIARPATQRPQSVLDTALAVVSPARASSGARREESPRLDQGESR